MDELVLTPSDFVGLLNQTLEIAYPVVVIEGELSGFKVSKGRWVYFNLKDENASVPFFGNVFQLPGPLEDGLNVRVIGNPRLHPRFGFSISFQAIQPVGEGSIKKASDILMKKLEAEGLFANERKRPLPQMPETVGLITAADSAACADFIKILNERWVGVEVQIKDVLVQGEQSPQQLVSAIEFFNRKSLPPDVLVMTRGGGSGEDLAAFNDERVVRAVAASRVPMLVAVGHEIDVSLAELAADMRASTPTNAATIVVPDRSQELSNLAFEKRHMRTALENLRSEMLAALRVTKKELAEELNRQLQRQKAELENYKKLSTLLDPKEALRRGYALVAVAGHHIKSVKDVSTGAELIVELSDGKIMSVVKSVEPEV